VKFGEMVREVSIHERSPFEQGLERFVGLDNLDPGSLKIKRWGSLADGTSFTKRFSAGQVLFGKRRVYQRKAALADFDGICSSDIIVLEAKPMLMSPELLPFFVQSDAFFGWAEATSSGSLSPQTKFKSLAEFQFALPPMERQRELVELFSALEETIRCTEEAIESAEQLKQSLMAELLTRGIGHTRFKQTEIGEIPEGWEISRIGDLLESCVYGISKRLHSKEVGIPVLRMGNIQNDRIDFTTLKYAKLSNEKSDNVLLRPGDILFNRTNSLDLVGKVAIVKEERPLSFASYLLRLRTNGKAISEWLFRRMAASDTRQRLRSIATPGVSQVNINPTQMRELLIAVPERSEQKAIIASGEEFDDLLDTQKDKLGGLGQIKNGLIQNLIFDQRSAQFHMTE
jgi:type I restriction enzyme S subunit